MGFKVLIAVDGSVHSEKAVQWYSANVHKPGYEVILAHVSDVAYFPLFGFKSTESLERWKEDERIQQEAVKKVISRHTQTLKNSGVASVDSVVESGSPGPGLVSLAEKTSSNLIVLGTRGQGTLSRTILGSVSDYVMHHATVPVCICAHQDEEVPPSDGFWSEMVDGIASQGSMLSF